MKKIISLIFVPTIALLSSCGQNNEAKANKLFVESAIKADSAMKEYKAVNIKASLSLLEEALGNCDKILLDYPETNIAVNLMSNSEINLGLYKYVELRGGIFNNIKNYSEFIDKYGEVGELLYSSDGAEKLKTAFAYFYNPNESEYKMASRITKEHLAYFLGKELEAYPIVNSPKATEEKPQVPSLDKDIDLTEVAAISKELKMQVDLIAYENSAIENLFKNTVGISNKPNLMSVYEPYLEKMQENVGRITLPELREKAYCTLSKIYANMDKSLAVNVALSKLKNEALSAEALTYYVDILISKGKLNNAMDLLGFIKIQSVKDDIALEIAKHLRDINPDQAFKVLAQCKNVEKRNDAFVEICAKLLLETNADGVATFLANNVKELTDNHLRILATRLEIFNREDFKSRSDEYIKLVVLGELMKLFTTHNKDFAYKFSEDMMAILGQLGDDNADKLDAYNYFIDASICAFPEVNMFNYLNSIKARLPIRDWQNICLKLAVACYLNDNEEFAGKYMAMINMDIVDREHLLVALLKANRSKEEILKVINI